MAIRTLFVLMLAATLSLHSAFAEDASRAAKKPRRSLVSTQFHYTSGNLIASTKDGTAAVRFVRSDDDGSFDYEYRYRPSAPDGKERTGTGTVSPVARKPAEPRAVKSGYSGEGEDDIVAGDVALLWGKGSDEWGWVHYMPEDVTVQVVFGDYGKLDLARFQRQGGAAAE